MTATTTLISSPLPPRDAGVGSSTPLPPKRNELSSKKSASGIDTSCQPPPATAQGPAVRDDTVVLELVVVRRVDRAVAVVVVLEVDLERVVLAPIGVDPEVEVLGARQVGRAGAAEAAVEAGDAARAPTGLEREHAAQRGREVGCVGSDAAAADRAVEYEPAVAERVAVLHVVEDDLVEHGGRAGGERDLVEVDLDVGCRAA